MANKVIENPSPDLEEDMRDSSDVPVEIEEEDHADK